MSAWFVETLTLRAWLSLPGDKPSVLYFIDASQAGLTAARRGGFKVERLQFRMIDVRDERGLLVRLRMAYNDLEQMQREIMAEPVFRRWLEGPGSKDRLPAALAKAVATIGLAPGTLWRAMYLIQVAAWKAKQLGETDAVLFLERRPWLGALGRYAARFGVTVRSAPPAVRPKAMAQRLLPPSWIALGQLAKREGAAGVRKFFAGGTARPERSGPKLFGEYWGQLNLDKPELNSDFFYLQESELDPKDVIVGFTSSVKPLDPPLYADLRKRGLDAVATHPAAASGEVPLHLPPRATLPALPKEHGVEGRWLARQTLEYHRLRAFWRELFEARDIKAFVSWYKSDLSHCAIADALDDVGGALALYQRSYEAMPTVELAMHAHVNFSYGRESAQILEKDGSRVRYNVIVGFIGDHRFSLLKPEADRLRAKLQAAGAKHIVAAYDENSIADARWHTGHDLQRSNYRLLCEKVLEDKTLGVIFKPKVSRTLRERLGPVAELLAKAEATGRCHVFEAGTMYAAAVPAAAALAADVVVHGHLCGGTAAVEAALAGKPTLMVDQEGWRVSPLYRLGVGKVVFKSWEDVWDALQEHWKTPGGLPGLGDWSAHLDDFDPFRDGKSAQRVGDFLADMMRGFKDGLSSERALANAAEAHATRWGADKISSVG